MNSLPPDRSFGHLIRDVNRYFQRELGRRIAPLGVSLGQWYALRVLWIQDGISQAEISQRAGVAAPSIVAALRSLAEHGYVVRDRHPTDQRKNIIFLTKAGRQLESICLAQAIEVNAFSLADLPEEDVETCMRVLRAACGRFVEQAEEAGAASEI
ncbi:MarR family winged helix-turn-helix transcriptional regulator [Salipiger abyssi]|uniref:MarR family winged helix-turn-helix transcriptional regulator n=1 Tax=Salipiger abyssi TaxID=1250539 RepID=UPI001A8FD99A|nr:MarR family transcriptional regulator [Salipiger abyssi]MBN9887105.1 MarR family transcriptional regulator [Salipiger abyssi]